MKNNAISRIVPLDYLRGLAAFSIMIYHYSTWSFGEFSSEDVLGRIGLYGVSIFYVLSGLTLFHVYFHRINQIADLKDFYWKRVLRIFPLMWLTILLTSLVRLQVPDSYKLILNSSGLFSVIDPSAYIGTGMWSIGNELAFYLFFPLFVFLAKLNWKGWYYLMITIIASIYLFFAFYVMPSFSVLKNSGSHVYINPLNQVFLFLGGFLIGYFMENKRIDQRIVVLLFAVSLVSFIYYPVEGNRIFLLQGVPRIAFTMICLTLCVAFYKLEIIFPRWIDIPLTKLGEYSYSLYLLHPIVWFGLIRLGKFFPSLDQAFDVPTRFLICAIISLCVSPVVYHYYEKAIMKAALVKKNKFVLRNQKSA